ncbi:MAG: LamG domain-containing protein, partial [Opitutales bacterium]|nr:LamG domain-containing protein [Opitutales bacterium]
GTIIGQGNPGHPGDWVSTSVRISTSLITGIQDIYICYEGSSGCIRWSDLTLQRLGAEDGNGYAFISEGDTYKFTLRNTSEKLTVSKFDSSGVVFFTVNVDRDGDLSLYTNGTNAPAKIDISNWSSTDFTNDLNLTIGDALREFDDLYWSGKIDNLRFYNRLLSPTEIESLFSEKNPTSIHYGADNGNPINVHYMAIEEGVYDEATHGFKGEAKVVESTETQSKGNWNVAIPTEVNSSFNDPVVFGQVMTSSDQKSSVFWWDGPGGIESLAISVGKHSGEDPDPMRENESIGLFVVESGNYTLGNIEFVAGTGAEIVRGAEDSSPFSYSISGIQGNAQQALLSKYSTTNLDGSWPVLYDNAGLTNSELKLFADEDRYLDIERSGPAEQFSYLVVGDSLDWLGLDSDNDGLPDFWERKIIYTDTEDLIDHYNDVIPDDDFDGDGLRNELEYFINSEPTLSDTDSDSISDADEYFASTSFVNDADFPDGMPSGSPPMLDGWSLHSINSNNRPFKAYKEGTQYRIAAVGTEHLDKFGLLSKHLSGDFILTAQIMAYEQLDPQLGGAEMGLMVRNGTGERDAFASVSLTQSGEFYFSNRPYENWSVDRIQSYGNEGSVPNVYLQLRKVGNRVYAYRSADNVSWFEVGE